MKTTSILLLGATVACLSGCVGVVPTAAGPVQTPIVIATPVVQAPPPVLVYPAEPLVEGTVVIGGRPYYRHYLHGHPYYHYRRP